MIGITAYGAYIPRRRLQRKAVAEANRWFAPGLVGGAKGERAMANFDEDSVTLAVEAGRDCLPATEPGTDRAFVDAIYFASTTLPFEDRQNAGIVAAALQLCEGVSSADVSSSQRAGLSALVMAMDAVGAGRAISPLVVAGEHRKARAASPQELAYGDAAAALTVGNHKVIARFIGSQSRTVDFVDHFRGEGEDFDYGWEERWIRDEGYTKIVPGTVKALLDRAGVAASDIAHFILPCPFAKLDQQIAKLCGIDPAKTRDNLASNVGDSGAAHALLMLVHALESAKPGEKILVAQFGQGCEALLFEVTPAIADLPKRDGVTGALARRKEETNYLKYLGFNGLVELEKGMRAEVDKRTALSVLYRKNDMLLGLVGGKCRQCGTAQFPKSRVCVSPNCKAIDSQDDYGFSERTGQVLSWSADFLTYSMDPPNHYGMITFADGGRFMADITDVEQGQIDTGTQVRMSFRVKDRDEKRGFVRYFWKAVPV
ncbi:MAG TPA: 3-oxoacyl-[acyl-carrier-protein] synthase III C-terminal domain-containing protein [Rhizomicrobium sp.]|nr:3-oxoacyl-[acyl-carrier-protein] synthase III C-terminal domain-containing protein [Rhizomicrobium sp.]